MSHWRSLITGALLLVNAGAHGEVVNISQATNLSLAVDPSKEYLVIDLLGGLWRLPVSGGGAIALMPAGSGIAQPRFDSSGQSLVFQRWRDGQWDIWQLSVATGEAEPLLESDYNEREPEYSADGSEILFSSDRGGRYALWAVAVDGGELRKLTEEPGDARFPTVGENGALAYASLSRNGSEVRVYEDRPQGRTLIRSRHRIEALSWRPGGDVLVVNERDGRVSTDLQLFVDADEPIWRGLTDSEDVFIGRPAWLSAEEYVYAADGALWRRIIGSRQRTRILLFAAVDVEPIETSGAQLYAEDDGPFAVKGINGLIEHRETGRIAFTALGDLWLVENGDLARLTDDDHAERSPTFTSDGDWLVFTSDREGGPNLWRYEIASGQTLQLTDEPGATLDPTISGDGRFVAFQVALDGARTVKLIEPDRPFASTELASGLLDAGELVWQGRNLRLDARDEPDGPRYPHVFETAAEDGSIGAVEGPAELAAVPDSPALAWERPEPSTYVVQAGRLFDGIQSEYRYHVDVHVEGRLITAVVGRGRLPLPERVFDASEMTVLPGLIDVLSHHDTTGGDSGRDWLRHGVTTVRFVAADVRAAIEQAEIWSSGAQPGPRLIVAPVAGQAPPIEARPILVESRTRIHGGLGQQLADQMRRNGWGLPAGLALPPRDNPDLSGVLLSPLGRTYGDVLGSLDAAGVYVATGIGAVSAGGDLGHRSLIAEYMRTLRQLGRIAVGSDFPHVPAGSGFHDELRLLDESGTPTDQILRLATSGGAVALGLSLELGTIEPGRLADLLIVAGDPLSRLQDLERVETTIVAGRRFGSDGQPAP